MTESDVVVLGAGPAGLRAALQQRRTDPATRLCVVDAAPRPGGAVATQRSNGFVCELGPFAFTADEIQPLLALLQRPPTPIPARAAARSGWLFDGVTRRPIAVTPEPLSFRSGNEELVQACRLELGGCLRLGRAATAIDVVDGGFVITLAGDPPSRVTAAQLVLALPPAAAGRLLMRFDPALQNVVEHAAPEPRAFAFFGGIATEAKELQGYGVLPADDVDTPVAELIFCTEVFPGRALPDRCLVRAELVGPLPERDDEALALAEAELREWTGTRAAFGFTKLHRFEADSGSGATAEVRARVRELCARLPGLSVAG